MHIVISGATTKKINRTKSLFFEKINQVDKNLATLTKKMREDTNYQTQKGKNGHHCQTYKNERIIRKFYNNLMPTIRQLR